MGALHLGLTPWQISAHADAATLARRGQLAESWGYRSFWLPEHHFVRSGATPEPLMLLAAARTRTILLGTTSFLLPLRNPLQAAEQVAVPPVERACRPGCRPGVLGLPDICILGVRQRTAAQVRVVP